jgi:dTDP-4-amino-4,6-dideoxygalactose transaminase
MDDRQFWRCSSLQLSRDEFFNTFEGGAVVTNNDELAARIPLMKNFGFSDQAPDWIVITPTSFTKMLAGSEAMNETVVESTSLSPPACLLFHLGAE